MTKKAAKTTATIEHIDCVTGMRQLPEGSVNLVCCDPPYNISKAYDSYDDNKPHDEFMAWMKTWLAEVVPVLHEHGSFFCFAPDEWVSELDVFCRYELGLHRRSWIVWHFSFGVANQRNFSRSHTHILYFVKTKTKFTFNADAIRVPSARQLVYGDKRQNAKGKLPDNSFMLLREQIEPEMGADRDSWMVSRVCGTFKERQKHSPNQIPVPLLERIVLAASNPGDLVLDAFCGTASTGVACALHGRNFIGYDISPTCVEESRRRLAEAGF